MVIRSKGSGFVQLSPLVCGNDNDQEPPSQAMRWWVEVIVIVEGATLGEVLVS